jgi:hypothetical protein
LGGLKVHQLVLPQEKRLTVIRSAHDSLWSNHLAVDKTLRRVQAYFFWPEMRSDIDKYIKTCEFCQKKARLLKLDRVPIKAIEYPQIPFSTLNLDLIGPIDPKSSRGHQYILCIIDNFSRWVECVPLKSLTAREVVDSLVSIFCRIGIPQTLRNDNGVNFVSGLNKELYERLGIKMRCSTPLHPEANGLVERWNQTLKSMLKIILNSDKPRDWDKKLQYLLWSYREVPNCSTGLSPYQMVYGRVGRGPLSVLRDTWSLGEGQGQERKAGNKEYFELLKEDLKMAAELAEKHCMKAQESYVKNYNKCTKEKEFAVGDLVLILIPDSSNKILSQWQGPAVITAVLSDHAYRVALESNGSVRSLHANKLRHYRSRVQTIGVIFESDSDFGDIEYCPVLADKIDSGVEINKLDFSYLTQEQGEELRALLLRHAEVFSDKPGCCNTFEHQINLVDGFQPKRQRAYRIPEKLREEVDRQLEQLLLDKKIRPSNSPFSHPLVCIAKPNGELRLCTDLRYVNSGTINDSFPTPITDELVMKISGANFISTLDNTSGYWQIPIREEDCYKTAFISSKGLFEWVVLPFGLKTASAMYCRVMNDLLAPHNAYSDAFIDDSAIYSENWRKHLIHLEAVLQSFQDVGMTLRLSKCKFGKGSVKYIGHRIGSGLREPLFDKIEAINKIEVPKTKKLLRSFLGCCAFYRSYVKGYSELALPLTELTKNKYSNTIKFNEVQSAAFKNLKNALANYVKLHSPRYDREFILKTDSSDYAVGAVLAQLDDEGVECPIAFASAKLTDAQLNYPIIQKEAWALIFALKKFDVIVFGSHIEVFMDHNPLQYVVHCVPQCARLTRWSLSLARYDLKINHLPGIKNTVADCMSRC